MCHSICLVYQTLNCVVQCGFWGFGQPDYHSVWSGHRQAPCSKYLESIPFHNSILFLQRKYECRKQGESSNLDIKDVNSYLSLASLFCRTESSNEVTITISFEISGNKVPNNEISYSSLTWQICYQCVSVTQIVERIFHAANQLRHCKDAFSNPQLTKEI